MDRVKVGAVEARDDGRKGQLREPEEYGEEIGEDHGGVVVVLCRHLQWRRIIASRLGSDMRSSVESVRCETWELDGRSGEAIGITIYRVSQQARHVA